MQIERFKIGAVTPETEWEKGADKSLDRFFQLIYQFLNNGLRIEDNVSAEVVTVTTGGADTEATVAHSLKRVPIGYHVMSRDKAAIIYDSGTAWTDASIYIKCNVASTTVKILIY